MKTKTPNHTKTAKAWQLRESIAQFGYATYRGTLIDAGEDILARKREIDVAEDERIRLSAKGRGRRPKMRGKGNGVY